MRWLAVLGLLDASLVGAAEISRSDLSALPTSEIVVLGEIHDNPVHHANQASVVSALGPRALVFEMLTPDQAARLPSDRRDRAAVDQAIGWTGSGWPDFAMYHPIFRAAGRAAVFGADVAPERVRQAMTEGAAAAFGPGAARFGLDRPLPPAEQATREAEQAEAHCGMLSPEVLPAMVQAQRLRDAQLAHVALEALEETGGPVVVITGTGHARRDWGVPALIARNDPGIRVLSLGQLESDPGSDAPFDLWIVTPAPAREDPCLAFAPPDAPPDAGPGG
jgi:uncharacterized iron-regulated protein